MDALTLIIGSKNQSSWSLRPWLALKHAGAEFTEDIARVLAVWAHCRERFGGGPFLFGDFTVADAVFAPVVSRFRTYDVALEGADRDYADAVWELPEMQEWAAAAAE
jgi:glutathione S-transferase